MKTIHLTYQITANNAVDVLRVLQDVESEMGIKLVGIEENNKPPLIPEQVKESLSYIFNE
ncbi:MAG: hypothetical protein LBN27_10735 [Prevotellaceae bacterium]|jgi:hypothetical protein|nr:hypothetical protein [Prevotellaceae bacterium]